MLELIKKYKNIVIFRHKRPDPDAIGSQMGLKEILKLNFPDKKIYAVGEDGYKEFNFIGELDYIKVSDFKDSLGIIVDTANEERIEDEHYKLCDKLIKIDHHIDEESQRYGELNIIDSNSSSCSEVIYNLCEQNKFKLNENAAKYLFCGIYADTGGFRFPTTSKNTFRIISKLREFNWDYEEVIMNLTTFDLKSCQMIGYAYQNVSIIGDVGFMVFDRKLQLELGCNGNDISLVANFLGTIKQLNKWVIFNQYSHNFIRVNIRSRKEFDISKVANIYSGGGHRNASGASLNDFSKVDEIVNVLVDLKAEID